MKRVCVIGSINMDLVVENERFVKPGETVQGINFFTYPGGKGANQAVACARLGGNVSFVGMVGDDIYGKQCLDNLSQNGVDTAHIDVAGSTGIALIEVEKSGENRIVAVSGSNGLIDCSMIDRHMDFILNHDIFLLQNEIQYTANRHLIQALSKNSKTIIFDPAPAAGVDMELTRDVSYITPNNSELEVISGECGMQSGIRKLEEEGIFTILKAGKDGAYILKDDIKNFPAVNFGNVLDTTGAGDTFNGAFAYALANDYSLEDAIILANRAAGFSVTKKGAQTGAPTLDDIR